LARIGGLAEPLPAASNASDLDTLWRQFVRVESHKRTFFALYQFDVMWYHILSIPRTISHLEIKLELPCPQDTWTASTSSDWAHRSLTMGKSTDQGPSRYIQAVRTCMSPNPSSCSPKYDAHGGLLIILFMLSSVREQSGWSTMTGRVSFERFEVSMLTILSFFELMPGFTFLFESSRGDDGFITAEWEDVGRMRSNLAYVDDRAASLVDTSYKWRRGRFIGCCSSRWVSSCSAFGGTC